MHTTQGQQGTVILKEGEGDIRTFRHQCWGAGASDAVAACSTLSKAVASFLSSGFRFQLPDVAPLLADKMRPLIPVGLVLPNSPSTVKGLPKPTRRESFS
jgi:hypothetical protein